MPRDIRYALLPDVQKRSRAHAIAAAGFNVIKWWLKAPMLVLSMFVFGGTFGSLITGSLQIALQALLAIINGLYAAVEPSEMESRHADFAKRYENLYKRLLMCTDDELSAEAISTQDKWFNLLKEEPQLPFLVKRFCQINGMTTSLTEVAEEVKTNIALRRGTSVWQTPSSPVSRQLPDTTDTVVEVRPTETTEVDYQN